MPADDPQLVSSSGSYTIDGGDHVPFNFSAVVDENPWGRIMFTASDLTPGNHTLSVTYHGNSTVKAPLKPVDLSLDYLLVTHAPVPPPKSTVGKSPTATHSVPTNKGHPDKTNKGINKAAIAGGVVAGLILLCSVFAIIFVLRRRRMARRYFRSEEIDVEVVSAASVYSDAPPIVEPFYILPEMRQAVSTKTPAVLKKNDANVRVDASQEETGRSSSTSLEHSNVLRNRSSSSSLSGSNPQPPSPNRIVSRMIQHKDSGVRLPSASGSSVVEVPPQYTEN